MVKLQRTGWKAMGQRGAMISRRLWIGTSGWAYDGWTDRFYPRHLRPEEWLRYYAREFLTVEINMTFYRLPFEGMIRGWNRRAPEGFRFAAKGSRFITHRKRLRDVTEALQRYRARMEGLRALSIVLWQLPPGLRKDLERLERFLKELSGPWDHAVEFRDESWWSEDTVRLLSRHGIAFCAVSHPRLPSDWPDTSRTCYLRFHGLGRELYRYRYSQRELQFWAEQIGRYLEQGREVYVYFNNDYRAYAIENARMLRAMLGD